jgi:MalT-like TPR region
VSPDAQGPDSRDLLGQVRLIRAFRLARESLEYLPEEDLLIRHLATWIVGFSNYLDQDLIAAHQALDTLERSPAEGSLAVVLSFHMRASFQMLQEYQRQAAQTFRGVCALPKPICGARTRA